MILKTGEQLKKHSGKKVTITYKGQVYKDCEITVEDDSIYILSNHIGLEGYTAKDLKGYAYSYMLQSSNATYEDVYIKYVTSIELTEYHYATLVCDNDTEYHKKPEWFDDRPIYVKYSDESEEHAAEHGEIGLLIKFRSFYTGNYPYVILTEETDVTKTEVEYSDNKNVYAYAVPYSAPDVDPNAEEITAIREEMEKLADRLKTLENK